jgi:hypothetical protein
MMSGSLGEGGQESRQRDFLLKITDNWAVKGDGHYKFCFGGRSQSTVEGEKISFEIIPESMSYRY